jgi:hypothetical protein
MKIIWKEGGGVALGCVYGPNSTDRNFYNFLDNVMQQIQRIPVVLAGDWNTTWDNSPPANNIDVINMARAPNQANGRLLEDLAIKHNLTEPFRALNPTKIAFSYSPFGVQRKNRSRLDFFIISTQLLELTTKCDIFAAHLSNMFDHKPVVLNLGVITDKTNSKAKSSRVITNWFLDDPLVRMTTELSCLQVYANSLTDDHIEIKQQLVRSINIMTNLLLESTNLKEKIALNFGADNNFDEMLLAAKISEFADNLENLPNWETLCQFNNRVNSKDLFCAITDRITDKVSGMQKKLCRFKNMKKSNLEKKIENLGKEYKLNEKEICKAEKDLRNLNDYELRHLISEKKMFENLNHEQPSKTFLDLAKAIAKNDDISAIRDSDGNVFNSENDRDKHITDFFSNLYRKDEEVGGTIEEFLGPDICQHPLVQNSKLTNFEKEGLDVDLTIDELSKALRESNLRSAPGIDGFSNKFISKFWYILSYPFFHLCTYSLAEGTLIDSFATAQIRIIPKKGDTTKLKNWRPISLLSNFYKILSRAINNRLKTVVNRVLSRAQKGFTKSRQIQEVILNLDENINRCKNMNIKGAMICVDQSKAFDSVDHQYIEKVFRFFNFGDRFISWLKTIGTNRKACVILGSGKKSDLFDLLKGTAQGDCPSPIIYNICAQILIFKIELSEDIRKLPIFNPDPINLQNIDANFNLESNLETTKNESFADDSTTFTYCEYGDLYALKTILESFAAISGLKCNFEKTTVVRIGDCTSDVDPRILELGFDFSSSCKLLGFQVTNNGDLHTENLNSLKKRSQTQLISGKFFTFLFQEK